MSAAWNLKLIGHSVDEFATFDSEILEKTDRIEEVTGIRVIEP